jgi:hypothetical protein
MLCSVVGPLLCFDCPRGASCSGRLDVQAIDGFWKGKDMMCPNSRCDDEGVCNPKYCESSKLREPGAIKHSHGAMANAFRGLL